MPIFRSTGCALLHMVFSNRCCGCGPTEPVCSLVHSAQNYTQRTTCIPEDGHIDARNM